MGKGIAGHYATGNRLDNITPVVPGSVISPDPDDEQETGEMPKIPRKAFRCKSCHAVFGETDQIRLFVGDIAIFTLKVTMTCANCGEIRVWRPLV